VIIVRDVFQAKYGKGGELVALFKEARETWPVEYPHRILSDASGPFFTIVAETEVASLAAWEQHSKRIFSLPEFAEWFSRMEGLVDSGRRDFYNVES
jgi:hypothetical protein